MVKPDNFTVEFDGLPIGFADSSLAEFEAPSITVDFRPIDFSEVIDAIIPNSAAQKLFRAPKIMVKDKATGTEWQCEPTFEPYEGPQQSLNFTFKVLKDGISTYSARCRAIRRRLKAAFKR